MFVYILMTCINQLNGERSIGGIYNLLTGKRSTQTLQDSYTYQLTAFFGIYKQLERDSFMELIKNLQSEDILIVNGEKPQLTHKGISTFKEMKNDQGPLYFDGMRLHAIIHIFEERLFLYIQTITSLVNGKKDFLPLSDTNDVLQWVKNHYKTKKRKLPEAVNRLYHELELFLSQIDSRESEIFTYRVTGADLIGLSKQQLAKQFNMDIHDVHLHLQHTLHLMYRVVEKKPQKYKELSLLLGDDNDNPLITHSAKRTYQMLLNGMDLEDISMNRGLKMSTIHDHVVEVALCIPEFAIEKYISISAIKEINEAMDGLKTKRLKEIYDVLEGKYDYFTIRLVMARNQPDKNGAVV
ncbi:helix-turn-helix domain-containing protein [Thalassobacillus pellis]|uniref:helix-turn-helix domain-containing protein n=1 Tax=Thalassobacillus pellis TaxID=748008 RepID=UPI001960D15B|nr:helix-turn-helix domain-containing protein [Thalassobacillus pellis]MBM7552429.1 uncharacterized protein YpbB [Thalassobacillus pellis]